MKKLLSILLAVAIVFGLCACAGSGSEGDNAEPKLEGLCAGYSKIDVTPSFSVGLGGYSDAETRRSDSIVSKIFVTCIAFSEGEETVLLYTVDNCAAGEDVLELVQTMVSPAVNVPKENIYVGATHTHSAPSLTVGGSDVEGTKYKELFYGACLEAAQAALADRAQIEVYSAKHEVPGMNFVRHYIMNDGTYYGSNFGSTASGFKGHAAETDPQMVVVKLDRLDESKKDICLINWQAHPDWSSIIGFNSISSSFVGFVRDEFEMQTGMHCAYFTGASGNQNPESLIPSEKHFLGVPEYGKKLGQEAVAALAKLEKAPSTGLKAERMVFAGEVDHSWDKMINEANEVYDLWKSKGKEAGDALGKTYGFSSSYQARAIKSRYGMDATRNLTIGAFNVGGIGFVSHTYEMFSTSGLQIKEKSPFDTTFIVSGNSSYIPSLENFENYRSYEADTGFFAAGVAEKLVDAMVDMLKKVQ